MSRVVSMLALAVAYASGFTAACGGSGIYADMHDGDQKKVTVDAAAAVVTIVPYNNDQSWIITSQLDTKFCNASIDFDVPGKPGVPPVPLLATIWSASIAAPATEKTIIEFTDPSGTIGEPGFPLNAWVLIG
uniref:Uncharacterized protein n=1 Tax=Coccolithus braarudii TaxID=221442 RepID=A0A7S0PX18_9EUKA